MPVSAIVKVWPPPLSATDPVCEPDVAGVKVSWIEALWPAARFTGKLGDVMLKSAPVTVGCAMDTLPDVPFVIVSVEVALWPTVTVPKSRLAFAKVTEPLGGGVLADELFCTAWQPANAPTAKIANRVPAQRLAMASTC